MAAAPADPPASPYLHGLAWAAVLVAVPIGVAGLLSSPVPVFVVAVTFAAGAALARHAVLHATGPGDRSPDTWDAGPDEGAGDRPVLPEPPRWMRSPVLAPAVAFAVVPVVVGTGGLFGPPAAATVTAAVACGTAVAMLVPRRPGTVPADDLVVPPPRSAPREPLPPLPPAEVTTDLTDGQLCWAWRRSYAHVAAVRTADELARAVDLRRGYLEEMERRCPAGFARWLASGARAAGDPAPYLLRRPA